MATVERTEEYQRRLSDLASLLQRVKTEAEQVEVFRPIAAPMAMFYDTKRVAVMLGTCPSEKSYLAKTNTSSFTSPKP